LRGSEATEKKRLMALQEVGESSHRSLSFFEDALLRDIKLDERMREK
jgi:hypothetical protein